MDEHTPNPNLNDSATPRSGARSLRRRLRRVAVVLIGVPTVVLAILPWLIGSPPGRALIVMAANQYLAPAQVELAGLSLSWLGGQSLNGLNLFEPHGKRLVAVDRLTSDRGLIELMFDPRNLGTLTVDGPVLDVTRRTDGSIDLADLAPASAKKQTPVAHPDPDRPSPRSIPDIDLTLKLVGGSVPLHAPELIEPLIIDRLDLTAKATAASGPWTVRLRMAQGQGTAAGTGAPASTLGIDGAVRSPRRSIASGPDHPEPPGRPMAIRREGRGPQGRRRARWPGVGRSEGWQVGPEGKYAAPGP